MDYRWFLVVALGTILSLSLLLLSTTVSILPFLPPSALLFLSSSPPLFAESKLSPLPASSSSSATLPRLAYLISGSTGDGSLLQRTLLALYHPRNLYVLHLDRRAPFEERLSLRSFLSSNPVLLSVGNVKLIHKSNLITYRGPTMVANTLHAASDLLLRRDDWDWFINLSATDYPLVTQDDLLHAFSLLPRDLNFLEHTSNIGWKAVQRAKPVIVDPGLYLNQKRDVFWISQKRSIPTAFKLFTGSAWMALSRSFVDYCIWGWDNLPRMVLMYYTNFLSSPEGYFHTVICNAKDFHNTTVNHDLHFISWDNPPKQHPHDLNLQDYSRMVNSDAPFARKFPGEVPVLDKIDRELLSRKPGMFVPGGWCAGNGENGTDPCLVVGNTTTLQPGPGYDRLQRLMDKLLSEKNFRPRQCK